MWVDWKHRQASTWLCLLLYFPLALESIPLCLICLVNFYLYFKADVCCHSPCEALLTVYSFSIFGCKEYNQCDFGIDHLVMSMCRIFSCVVGRGCLLWPVCFLGKTLLAFALLHFVLQGQIYLLLKVSLDFILLPSSPMMKRKSFFWS